MVTYRMRGEQHQLIWVREDGAPDDGGEQPDACLCDYSGAENEVLV